MKIRMLKSVPGSETGSVTRVYESGTVYEMGASPGAVALAEVFLREGWAEVDAPPAKAVEPEPKVVEPEPRAMFPEENKAITAAPRNKGRGR